MARKGRQGTLNRGKVIAGALQLIDEEGLEGLSMRRLAEKLGVKPMSLYSHVTNKDDLLDGVIVKVLEEIELPAENEAWDQAVKGAFRSYRRVLLRHPNVAPIIMRRPVRDIEGFLGVLDYSLGLLSRGGLDRKVSLHGHRILTAFTTGMVMNQSSSPERNPILLWTKFTGPDRFPNVFAAMPEMLNTDMDETFDAGLDMILHSLQSI